MAKREFIFTGKGDFSDFNKSVREAAKNMSSEMGTAYDSMLQNAAKYSENPVKQRKFVKGNLENFKESQIEHSEGLLDSLSNQISLERKNKLSEIGEWRKEELSDKKMRSEYKESYGQDYDPYSGHSQSFKKEYQRSINEAYQEEKKEINQKSDSQYKWIEELKEYFNSSLEDFNPKNTWEKIEKLAILEIVEARKNGKSLEEIITKYEQSGDINEQLLASQLRKEYKEEQVFQERGQRREESRGTESIIGEVIGGIIGSGFIERVTGFGSKVMTAKDGTEGLRAMMETGASLAGGLSQIATNVLLGFGDRWLGLDKSTKHMISATVGGVVEGGFSALGEGELRSIEEQNTVWKQHLKNKALTGSNNVGPTDLSSMGYDFTSVSQENYNLSRTLGRRATNDEVQGSLAFQKGFEVDSGSISQLIDIQRSSGKNIVESLGRILTVGEESNILQKDDRTFFPELVGRFTSLQRNLLRDQTEVNDSQVMGILSMFNKIGGQFDIKDFRSEQNINNIHEGLKNPETDSDKAMAYRVISQENPQMDPWQIRKEIEKGVSSEVYRNGVLGFIQDNFQDHPWMGKQELHRRFDGLNTDAIDDLWDNITNIREGKIPETEIQSKYNLGDIRKEADQNTHHLDKQQAEITNMFTQGMVEGAKASTKAMLDTIAAYFQGSTIRMENGVLQMPSTVPNIVTNNTKTPSSKKELPEKSKSIQSSNSLNYRGGGFQ